MGPQPRDEALEDVRRERRAVGHSIERVGGRDRHHRRLVVGAVEIGLENRDVGSVCHGGGHLPLECRSQAPTWSIERYGTSAATPRESW